MNYKSKVFLIMSSVDSLWRRNASKKVACQIAVSVTVVVSVIWPYIDRYLLKYLYRKAKFSIRNGQYVTYRPICRILCVTDTCLTPKLFEHSLDSWDTCLLLSYYLCLFLRIIRSLDTWEQCPSLRQHEPHYNFFRFFFCDLMVK